MNVLRLPLVCLGVLALSACGGKSEAEKEREHAAGAASATVCDAPKLRRATGLPAGFPQPKGVTYKAAKAAGPSRVVDATYDGDVDAAFDAYEKAVDAAGYDVLFKEKEEDDAEISYAGGGRTGQIALRDVCDDGDTIVVHITSRPE
jgi:hypothetical protein